MGLRVRGLGVRVWELRLPPIPKTTTKSQKLTFFLNMILAQPHEVIQANRIKGFSKGMYGNEDVQSTQWAARPSEPYKPFEKGFILFAWITSCGWALLHPDAKLRHVLQHLPRTGVPRP